MFEDNKHGLIEEATFEYSEALINGLFLQLRFFITYYEH